jgi:hypothetical protein
VAPAKEHWVLVIVERGSGNTLIIPVPDQSAETFIAVMAAWIKPGTTVISDLWVDYGGSRGGLDHGYSHQVVNYRITFVEDRTGARTYSMEGLPEALKSKGNYICNLVEYMFAAECKT